MDSSDSVLFFKEKEIKEIDGTSRKEWVQYYELEEGGFIYFIKGSNIIQITTPKLIYFYKIDEESYIPELLNSMYNFMDCSVMMLGVQDKYCITYKMGQMGFNIYRRQYFHKFMATIESKPYEHSQACTVNSTKQYLVSNTNII